MRDGRSKTAPIINHRMIHSIVPSPRGRAFVPPQNQILERKLELSRKRSPPLPGESLPRPYEGGNLSPLEPGRPRALSHTRAISLARRKPSHTSTYTPEPTAAFILVRSFLLLLDTARARIAPISRAVNFIFPRHFPLDVAPRSPLPPALPRRPRVIALPRSVYRYLKNYRLNFTVIVTFASTFQERAV